MKTSNVISKENKESMEILIVQNNYLKNKEDNLKKALKIIESCDVNTDCIVFPELYSCGYFMEKQYLEDSAESIEGPFITSIQEVAKKNGTAVCMPFLEKYKNNIFNSVAVINQFGEVVGIKRKFINWKSELGFISESDMGSNLEIFEINNMKIGILICYEACFPELARILANKKVDVIIITAFWNRKALSHWLVQLRARALDNNVYIVGVNGLYNEKSCGHSMVVAPDGEIVSSLKYEEGTLKAIISKSKIMEIREEIPYYKDYLDYIYRS